MVPAGIPVAAGSRGAAAGTRAAVHIHHRDQALIQVVVHVAVHVAVQVAGRAAGSEADLVAGRRPWSEPNLSLQRPSIGSASYGADARSAQETIRPGRDCARPGLICPKN